MRRRDFLCWSAGIPALIGCGRAATTRFTEIAPPYVTVETTLGRLRGGHCRGALAFKGIPYAGPVSGRGRFKAAPPAKPWQGVRDALRLGPPSLQGSGTTYGEDEPAPAEDCLFLNVWTPEVGGRGRRPVLFYCHGGGYVSGSAGSIRQDGARLAALFDVVVVGVNHRLGLAGHLYLGELGGDPASGNQGILDIVAALGWVRDNIAAFGGDPSRVMVFGESGGAYKVGSLMAMPGAKGLFHRASIESGAAVRRMTQDAASETTRRVLKALDIAPAQIARLAEVPGERLLTIQVELERQRGAAAARQLQRYGGYYAEQPGGFAPVVDGIVLPCQPFDPVAPAISADIPLLIGMNRDEAAFFYLGQADAFGLSEDALVARVRREFGPEADRILTVYARTRPGASPSERYIAITTGLWFGAETDAVADHKAKQQAPVFRYRFDYPSDYVIPGTSRRLGAAHATEIAMKFCNFDMPGLHGHGEGAADVAMTMSGFWTSFARNGVPSAPGAPAWAPYDCSHRATMLIDRHCTLARDPDREERRLWDDLAGVPGRSAIPGTEVR